jgi:acyl-CoA synthetase (AMP-forming)/AMP-acid ligase II
MVETGASSAGVSLCQGESAFALPELAAIARSFDVPPAGPGHSLAVHVPDGPLTLAAILWARRSDASLALLPFDLPLERARQLAVEIGCADLVHSPGRGQELTREALPGSDEAGAPGPSIVLLTSGTSGQPKAIHHSWSSLSRSVVQRPDLRSARWMTLYPLTRFAGLNTLLHAVLNEATLVVPPAATAPVVLDHLARWTPTHVAGTPSLWKHLLMSSPDRLAEVASVRQIVLGGEIVDQPLLSSLRRRFPAARISHVYATTEAGVCFSVTDGRAGFPRDWLSRSDRDVELAVRGDELWVRPRGPRSNEVEAGAEGGWWPTGDMVTVEGDRVYFRGRRSDLVNVGGAKVSPSQIEDCLLQVPGVLAARVSGRRSSLAGAVLVAEVVRAPEHRPEVLRPALIRYCADQLPRYAVPRIVEFVDHVPLAASGKTIRHSEQPDE